MSPSNKNQHLLIILLISVLVLLIYSQTFYFPFILDDELFVLKNYIIRSWKLFPNIFTTDLSISALKDANFYRPVQTITYLLDFQFWRLNVFGYHLTNSILFVVNSILVYFLIYLIGKDYWLAALSALLFASHPIYCEAVTYIAGRAEVLLGVFSILSLILFIRYSDFKGFKKNLGYSSSLFCFGLALLSKELAVIFPLALMLYDFSFNKDGLIRLRNFTKRHAPFILLTLIYILLRLTVLKFSDAISETGKYPLWQRSLAILANFNAYFKVLLYPFGLHMSRYVVIPKGILNWRVFAGAISLVFILTGMGVAYRKNRQIFFWSAWFMLWFIPQSGLFPINAFFAEHFIYLSAIGFFALLVYFFKKLLPRLAVFSLVMILMAVFSYGTILHNQDWQGIEAFYKSILRQNPKSWLAHTNLGNYYLNQRRYVEAENEYHLALALRPKLKIVHANLAIIHLFRGENKEADKEMAKSISLDNVQLSSPNFKFPQLKEYLNAFSKDWDLVNMYNGLGMLFARNKQMDYARQAFETAITLSPSFPDAHWNLGSLYWRMGDYQKARHEWEITLRLEPGHIYARQWLDKIKSPKR